jgi:hypothetical protein
MQNSIVYIVGESNRVQWKMPYSYLHANHILPSTTVRPRFTDPFSAWVWHLNILMERQNIALLSDLSCSSLSELFQTILQNYTICSKPENCLFLGRQQRAPWEESLSAAGL